MFLCSFCKPGKPFIGLSCERREARSKLHWPWDFTCFFHLFILSFSSCEACSLKATRHRCSTRITSICYHLLCSFDQWKLRSTLACSVQLDDAVFFVMRLFQEQIFFELAVLLLHTVKLVCESLQHCFILSGFDISAGDMCQGLGISLGTHVGSPFANCGQPITGASNLMNVFFQTGLHT